MPYFSFSFFFNDTPTTEIYTLSLHDALPISPEYILLDDQLIVYDRVLSLVKGGLIHGHKRAIIRSEEHTSELQSQFHLVCRLLLEKKKKHHTTTPHNH